MFLNAVGANSFQILKLSWIIWITAAVNQSTITAQYFKFCKFVWTMSRWMMSCELLENFGSQGDSHV